MICPFLSIGAGTKISCSEECALLLKVYPSEKMRCAFSVTADNIERNGRGLDSIADMIGNIN